jgi:hypothetical protein
MDKVVRITSLKDKGTDFLFWKTKTDQERLEAIEFLRQQYFSLNKDIQQGFQRVCRVIEK